MQIGEKIRKIREFKNFTQQGMAEAIGVSQNAYSKIETGKTKSINDEILEKIALALDVSKDEIQKINEDFFIFNNTNQSGGNCAAKMTVFQIEGSEEIKKILLQILNHTK